MNANFPTGYRELDCRNAEKQGDKCLGYSKIDDDEPIETCKQCEKCTMYEEEKSDE